MPAILALTLVVISMLAYSRPAERSRRPHLDRLAGAGYPADISRHCPRYLWYGFSHWCVRYRA